MVQRLELISLAILKLNFRDPNLLIRVLVAFALTETPLLRL